MPKPRPARPGGLELKVDEETIETLVVCVLRSVVVGAAVRRCQ